MMDVYLDISISGVVYLIYIYRYRDVYLGNHPYNILDVLGWTNVVFNFGVPSGDW